MPLTQVNSGLLESGAALANIGSGNITPAYLNTQAQYTGFKNRIINGAMVIAQRGTSFTNVGSGGPPTYSLDRWFGYRGGFAANLDMSQQAGFSGYKNCLRVQRTSGTSSTQYFETMQIIENLNCYDLAGQNVTLTANIRAGANYSGGQVVLRVYTSTTANDTSVNQANGTGAWSSAFSSNVTISTTAASFSVSGAIPSNAQTIAIQIEWTPTGTAGAADYIEVTGVQLEKGSTATSFDYRPYGTELALCQRYYIRYGGSAFARHAIGIHASTVVGYAGVFFPVNMRAAPSFNSSGSFNAGTPGTISSLAIDTAGTTSLHGNISVTETGATANQPLILQSSNSTTAYTEWSAEL